MDILNNLFHGGSWDREEEEEWMKQLEWTFLMILVTAGPEIEKKKKKSGWNSQNGKFLIILVTAAPEIELGGLAVRKCRERV